MAPVKGIVTLDGEPLTGGIVTVWPEHGRAASGKIQPDGTFVLTTYGQGDGAQVGTHPVSVSTVAAREGQELPPADRVNIPLWYQSQNTSGLTIAVAAGEPNETKLELRSKKLR